MGTHVRPARPSDLDALADLEARSFESHRIARPTFARMLLHATRPVLVLVREPCDEDADALAGYVALLTRRNVTEARIFSIAVAPRARGNGAGRTLLSAAEGAAARLGCSSVRLEVSPRNAPAIRLYESFGYRPVRTWPDYYGAGRPGVVYRRALGAVTFGAPCSTPTTASSND